MRKLQTHDFNELQNSNEDNLSDIQVSDQTEKQHGDLCWSMRFHGPQSCFIKLFFKVRDGDKSTDDKTAPHI